MKPEISDIPGIGPAATNALGEYGIRELADLAHASVEKISAIPGFSEARAARVIAAATGLLAATGDCKKSSPEATGERARKDKKKSKNKRKDKKKRKNKDKDKKKGKGKGKNKRKEKKKDKKKGKNKGRK